MKKIRLSERGRDRRVGGGGGRDANTNPYSQKPQSNTKLNP